MSARTLSDAERQVWDAAQRAMDAFFFEWFERKGGTRQEVVRAAFAADDAVERVHAFVYRVPALSARLDTWIDTLEQCPEVEKRWHGLAAYRERHRVKGRA